MYLESVDKKSRYSKEPFLKKQRSKNKATLLWFYHFLYQITINYISFERELHKLSNETNRHAIQQSKESYGYFSKTV